MMKQENVKYENERVLKKRVLKVNSLLKNNEMLDFYYLKNCAFCLEPIESTENP